MRQLVEVYALRAREFSDEVARLGEHQQMGEAFLGAIAQVYRRRAQCEMALTALERHLNQEAGFSVSTDQRNPPGGILATRTEPRYE